MIADYRFYALIVMFLFIGALIFQLKDICSFKYIKRDIVKSAIIGASLYAVTHLMLSM